MDSPICQTLPASPAEPGASLCGLAAIYSSGLWTLTVIGHSPPLFLGRPMTWRGLRGFLPLIMILYAQFVSWKETNAPPNIIYVIFTAQYVSFRGAY